MSSSRYSSNLLDDVTDTSHSTNDVTGRPQHLSTSSSGSSVSGKQHSPSHKHHGLFSKKSKAAKGLGFLIKASKETARRRSKSPSKSPSGDKFAEDFEPVDEEVKAKSEQWQAFLQMQDRIKTNVLKTQETIGKLAAGRISPSGRISPARRGHPTDDDRGEEGGGESTPWSHEAGVADDSRGGDGEGLEDGTGDDEGDGDFRASGDRQLPDLHVTPMIEETDLLGLDQVGGSHLTGIKPVPPSTPVDPGMEDVDLLGLGMECSADSSGFQAAPFVMNEDLLGLDDFLGPTGPSVDTSHVTDWFGSSTAYSSTQSSLCSSPVAFDLDFFLEQGQMASESTAVSDLARTLVDDFLQWGAVSDTDTDTDTRLPASTNPFARDTASVSKPSAFNPFSAPSNTKDSHKKIAGERFVQEDTSDGLQTSDPFIVTTSSRSPSVAPKRRTSLNPFTDYDIEDTDTSSVTVDLFASSSILSSAPPLPPSDAPIRGNPFQAPDSFSVSTSSVCVNKVTCNGVGSDSVQSQPTSVNLNPFGSSDVTAMSSSSTDLDPFSSKPEADTSSSNTNLDPFGFTSSVSVTSNSDITNVCTDTVAATSDSNVDLDHSESRTLQGASDTDILGFGVTSDTAVTCAGNTGLDLFSSINDTAVTLTNNIDQDEFGFTSSEGLGSDNATGLDFFDSGAATTDRSDSTTAGADPFMSLTDTVVTDKAPCDNTDTLDPFGGLLSAAVEPVPLDLNANPHSVPVTSSDCVDLGSNPVSINPFFTEAAEESKPSASDTFDDDFFSSKAVSSVQQDAASVWGTADSTSSPTAAFNPFEDDLFTGVPIITSDGVGPSDTTQPVNPFLTASCEDISVTPAPSSNVHQLFVASTDQLHTLGTQPAVPAPSTKPGDADLFGGSVETSSQPQLDSFDLLAQSVGAADQSQPTQSDGFDPFGESAGAITRPQTAQADNFDPFSESVATTSQSQPVQSDGFDPFGESVGAATQPQPTQPDGFDPFNEAAQAPSQAQPSHSDDVFDALGGEPDTQPQTAESSTQQDEQDQTAPATDNVDDDFNDDDEEDTGFKLKIRDKPVQKHNADTAPVPFLPPPPKRPKSPPMSPRENPFDKESPPEEDFANFEVMEDKDKEKDKELVEPRGMLKSMSSESSGYEDESVEPLEPYHPMATKEYWKLLLRLPIKKKLAGNRFWKTVFVKMVPQKDGPVLKVYAREECQGDVVQELALQPCYSLSELTAQQYDQYGKIHIVKLQYIFYRERVGIKPERITPSFVKKPKATMVLDHAPQVSELLKLGCLDLAEVRSFMRAIEDALMQLDVKREKTLTYTKDEVQAEVWDEYEAVIDRDGHTLTQKARVRVFFLAFLTGMPACELGINDRTREGKEVVGRHDIIPVKTEDWIRIENPEFHSVVDLDTYEKTSNIRFHPLDACHFELLRFRVRPRENRELPLHLRVTQVMRDRHYEVRCDMLVTGYHAFSKKCGQFPCQDIQVRFHIPDTWIYYFRYERKFKYGSLKAMTRKPGKIKGLERLTMMAQGFLSPALMEASVGSAKYEHLHRSVVWRVPQLPERNQGAYKNHLFVLRLDLGPHDEIPDSLQDWCDVEFHTPASTVSKCQVRSISVENPDPPEKWVRYVAKYKYRVQIDTKVETTSDMEHDD